ncbi:MAG: hypothetical protein JRE23_02720 [Deltaproteobacteria bacterium]|nr:hypothetical protein [Deltaproteobacteria bacterium]
MITGTKVTTIEGKPYRLRYTWAVLAEVNEKYGDSPDLFKPEVVAFVGAAGMRKKHPEMTPEKIMELSPPLIPFANDVQQALTWAYFGDKGMPEDEDVKKKQTLTGWIKRIKMRLLRVFRH